MPLAPQRLDNRVRDGLATALALCAVPVGVAIDTPRIPVLFDKRRRRVKRIAALGAEKVSRVPLCAARDHDLALDGRLAGFAPRGEALVKVQVAVEARGLVGAVLVLELAHLLGRVPAGEEGDVLAALSCSDAVYARAVLGGGLGVEGDAFELLAALVAGETFGVETTPACGYDAARDGERAGGALRAGADGCWCPVGAGGAGEGAAGGCVDRWCVGKLLVVVARIWQGSC